MVWERTLHGRQPAAQVQWLITELDQLFLVRARDDERPITLGPMRLNIDPRLRTSKTFIYNRSRYLGPSQVTGATSTFRREFIDGRRS